MSVSETKEPLLESKFSLRVTRLGGSDATTDEITEEIVSTTQLTCRTVSVILTPKDALSQPYLMN